MLSSRVAIEAEGAGDGAHERHRRVVGPDVVREDVAIQNVERTRRVEGARVLAAPLRSEDEREEAGPLRDEGTRGGEVLDIFPNLANFSQRNLGFMV